MKLLYCITLLVYFTQVASSEDTVDDDVDAGNSGSGDGDTCLLNSNNEEFSFGGNE